MSSSGGSVLATHPVAINAAGHRVDSRVSPAGALSKVSRKTALLCALIGVSLFCSSAGAQVVWRAGSSREEIGQAFVDGLFKGVTLDSTNRTVAKKVCVAFVSAEQALGRSEGTDARVKGALIARKLEAELRALLTSSRDSLTLAINFERAFARVFPSLFEAGQRRDSALPPPPLIAASRAGASGGEQTPKQPVKTSGLHGPKPC
jgi:hypothetical protein